MNHTKLKTFTILTIVGVSILLIGDFKAKTEILNVDGDLSYPNDLDAYYWNPHVFQRVSDWSIKFTDKVTMYLKSASIDAGHIATGIWWNKAIEGGEKIPLNQRLTVVFDIRLVKVSYSEDAWVRIALAAAFYSPSLDRVYYTELDVWDSPAAMSHPNGNINEGGKIVYSGGNVVEYKLDQIEVGEWRHYEVDLTDLIHSTWRSKARDGVLESVYIVIEVIGSSEVEVEVDNMWLIKYSYNPLEALLSLKSW